MGDFHDHNKQLIIFKLIKNPIPPLTHKILLLLRELLATGRPGILRQAVNALNDSNPVILW